MQWYNRQEAFYKERFNREIEYVNRHNELNKNKIIVDYWGPSKTFVVIFNYNKTKFIIWYPQDYPNSGVELHFLSPDEISGQHKNCTPIYISKTRKVWIWSNKICFYHNDWNSDWGVDYMIKRANEWCKKGKFNKQNDVLLSDLNQLFIMPIDVNSLNLRKWGYFKYASINGHTHIIKEIVNDRQHFTFDISNFVGSGDNLELKKGLYLANSYKYYHSMGPENILKKLLSISLKKHHKSLKQFLKDKNINTPNFILNINKKDGICNLFNTDNFFIDDSIEIETEKFDVNVAKLNSINDMENIIMDKKQLRIIKNKKVAFVGAGAIGSTLICQLVKSGLEKLTIIDNDNLEIGNIYRHELSLDDLGKNKAVAMKEKIRKINPNIECEAFDEDALSLIDQLLKCDLIISTVDNEQTRLILDEKLIPKNKTIINVNSFYDSIAGIIFIANKLKSSCYHCFEHYLSNFLTNNYLPDFKKLEEENPLEECGSSSVPGTSPNTSQIAIYGASVILDFLSNGYSKNSEGNNINLFIYSNNEIQQESRVYFANSPKVEKFSSPSYNKCQVCSHDKYEVSEEIEMNYIKNMETIEN